MAKLLKNDTRNTIQRNLVLDAVCKLHHPTADEIYTCVAGVHPAVSRGTVYRNLNLLVEQGRLRRVCVAGGADHFDDTLADHYHVRCNICGRVDDVSLPFQRELLMQAASPSGYAIESHDIMFRGTCPGCQPAAGHAQGTA